MSDKPRTMHGLQADLRAANAEVEGLMRRQQPIEEENRRLRSHVGLLEWQLASVRKLLSMTFEP